jgi:Elongation factor SelB, winged helix
MPATKTKASPVELHSKTRILLALWDLGGVETEVKRGELRTRILKKGEKIADYQKLFDELAQEGAIAITEKTLALNPQGEGLLSQNLKNADFAFSSSVGAKTANALLKWISKMGETGISSKATTNGKVAGDAIDSYEAFKTVALEVFDRLNRDYNLDNLVPIYRIRRKIGDRVSRPQFNDWMLELQSGDVLQLVEGTVEDSAPDKIEDSITTKLGKLRCYAKRISS